MLFPGHMENVTEQARCTSIILSHHLLRVIKESLLILIWYHWYTIWYIHRSTIGEALGQQKIALLIQADIYRRAYLHMHSMLASQVLHYSRFGTYQKIIPPLSMWENNRTVLKRANLSFTTNSVKIIQNLPNFIFRRIIISFVCLSGLGFPYFGEWQFMISQLNVQCSLAIGQYYTILWLKCGAIPEKLVCNPFSIWTPRLKWPHIMSSTIIYIYRASHDLYQATRE